MIYTLEVPKAWRFFAIEGWRQAEAEGLKYWKELVNTICHLD